MVSIGAFIGGGVIGLIFIIMICGMWVKDGQDAAALCAFLHIFTIQGFCSLIQSHPTEMWWGIVISVVVIGSLFILDELN